MAGTFCWDEQYVSMGKEALEQIQLEKLKKQLRYEYDTSTYFRERIGDAGIVPEEMKSLEEIQKIPLFTKDEHRKSQEQSLEKFGHPYGLHLCTPLEEVVSVNATSGTTGLPTFYTFTDKDVVTQSECDARTWWLAGVRPGDTVLHALALSMFIGGTPFIQAIQYMGATAVPVGAEGGTRRLLEFANLVNPDHVILTPSFAEYLSEKCPEVLGREIKELGIRTLICGGEPGAGDPAVRTKLEDAYGGKIYDAMGGAWGYMSIDCDHHHGQHAVTVDHNYMELIDPETKETVKMEDGAVGTIAYTSLNWEAGPVLRYDMGDVSQVFVSPCECGITRFRFRILGRSDDMLIVKGINVYPAAVKNLVNEFYPRTTGELRIVLDEPGPKVPPPLHIKVEYGRDEDLSKLKADIEQRAHDTLRFGAEVELVPAGTLERTSKKAKLIEKRFDE